MPIIAMNAAAYSGVPIALLKYQKHQPLNWAIRLVRYAISKRAVEDSGE